MDQQDRINSVIHNVKNKLQLMLPQLGDLQASDDAPIRESAIKLKLGMLDINRQLVALLSLNRLEDGADISLTSDVYVFDLLQSVGTYAEGLCELQIDCDTDLVACFDETLVKMVISDALHNAVKYSRGKILLKAHRAEGLFISVEDDGPGYAEHSNENDAEANSLLLDEVSGETSESLGLGMELAYQVAAAHQNHGRTGSIRLLRSETLGGAAFSLMLP